MPPLSLRDKGTSYSFPLLSLQWQNGKEKKKKKKETKQINRAICNPEHMAACQMPLTAATKKAFLSFVNISFFIAFLYKLVFLFSWIFRSWGGREGKFVSVLFVFYDFSGCIFGSGLRGSRPYEWGKKKERERERETHVCCVPPRPPVLPCHLYLHEWKTPERHFKPCQQGFMFWWEHPQFLFAYELSVPASLCGVWASRLYTVLIVVGWTIKLAAQVGPSLWH